MKRKIQNGKNQIDGNYRFIFLCVKDSLRVTLQRCVMTHYQSLLHLNHTDPFFAPNHFYVFCGKELLKAIVQRVPETDTDI